MKQIVISAVNLRKGGTLTILRQCLAFLSEWAPSKGYEVITLVHQRELADYPNIRYIEIPWAIEGWGKRLWCEYVTMGRIARELGPIDLWLSLHDTTPGGLLPDFVPLPSMAMERLPLRQEDPAVCHVHSLCVSDWYSQKSLSCRPAAVA